MQCLLQEAQRKVYDFNSQDIANTLNAMAKLDYKDDAVMQCMIQEARHKIDDFNAQNIAILCWSMLCLQQIDDSLLSTCMQDSASYDFDDEELSALYICERSISIEHPHLSTVLPHEVHTLAKQAWTTSLQSVQSSRLHDDVSHILFELGVEHENEAVVSGLSVDILIHGSACSVDETCEETRDVVIEVDGPSHYLRGDGGVSGSTRFKHRMLEKYGVKVLHVPYLEWGELHTLAAKKQYMKDKLHGECGSAE